MRLLKFRKLDYIIFYLLFAGLFIVQLMEVSFLTIIKILVICIVPSLIFGTLTNFIFKRKIKRIIKLGERRVNI
ncbi:MAG: hypothetical protein ACLUG9_07100 [Paraclostridium sordellii]|uniref:hypothetical protein n=1 Tax=Paraclostridium sordellii TaxID=1505 RepID=UPI0005DC3BA2|nr:hypothetical protein [Paeniclostridium sordellii]CEQ14627.1 Uncharacterised protein [[Clostridium] sordellii] [Paeniclostridium sordellii]